MATSLMSPGAAECKSLFTKAFVEERWYAAYTCANHEKRVAKQLEERAVEHFLPLYGSVRRWKDRRVELQLPLFPGYVFTRIALSERLRVLEIPSIVRLVGFNGLPSALPDEQIQALRDGFSGNLRADPHPCLAVGRRVRIIRGPLAGLEGILIRRKGALRVVISIELIRRAVSLEVQACDVQPSFSSRAKSAIAGQIFGGSFQGSLNLGPRGLSLDRHE